MAPVYRAVRDSIEVLGLSLTAIESTDLTKVPTMPGNMMGFRLTTPEEIDIVERKTTYTNWLLSKACLDLARSLNEALQEAYFYVEIFNMPDGTTTWGELQAKIVDIRTRANKMHFPELLRVVGERLNTPLLFADEYASLNKVRNCLEHRSGVVTERDVDANGKLLLRFPTIDIVIKTGDGEVVIAEQEEIHIEAGGEVQVRLGHMETEYMLGERVVLTAYEFQRICQGCLRFCADLGQKLPVRAIAVQQGPIAPASQPSDG